MIMHAGIVFFFFKPKYLFMQTYALDSALTYLYCVPQKQTKTLVGLCLCHAQQATHHVLSHRPNDIVCIGVGGLQTKG